MDPVGTDTSLKAQHKGRPLFPTTLSNIQGLGTIPDSFSQKDLKTKLLAQQTGAKDTNMDKHKTEKPRKGKVRKGKTWQKWDFKCSCSYWGIEKTMQMRRRKKKHAQNGLKRA